MAASKLKPLLITSIILSILTAASLSLYSEEYREIIFNNLRPPVYIYPIIGLIFLATAIVKIYFSGWEEAKPNEWLVIIENGEQVKAGIGLICFRWFWQTAIKFPSSVQRVNFNAMQVCQEMQGLQIQGFAVWSVHRNFPFTFYRQMFGVNANKQIQSICESIVRHQISNTELNTVMTQRDILKNNMQKEASKILSGWGVWVETVEITDVKICSESLFQDMQTPSKQENFLKSELYKIQKQSEMDISSYQSSHQINVTRLVKETERLENHYQQQIKRLQQESSYSKKQFEYQKQKIQQEYELKIQENQKNFELELKDLKDQQAVQQKERDRTRDQRQKEIKHEQELSDVNLFQEKSSLVAELYASAKVKELNINSYQEQSTNNLFNILPSLQV
ncbi:hypothetical protein PPERSA_13147 [Pseudocohnilembus persalinus]|uniref:Band 7 domain-containing protein n=1 Tax=Pseudocohnilembus persalinus TaxID=266149 RepID=A0A0V0QBQ5_PSEPJ|nr:hypothetical protein PPERSA_13147 [Pseudocohnilembus persalinus]|eukprot:KRW99567.1 hypothetical protein PPERSA_13147 [Pseudocohnilembus persalinus]